MSLTVVTGFQDTATTVITATHFASRPAVPAFHDALGYSAGVEKLPLPITLSQDQGQTRIKDYAFTDADGGVTVPSSGYYPPRLPEGFTGRGGETAPPNADVSTEETLMVDSTGGAYAVSIGAVEGLDISGAQTGNPGDYGKQLGFHMVVEAQAEDGSWGKVRIWRDADAAELSADASAAGPLGAVDVALNLTNIGGAGDLLVYSDFDEAVLTYVGGAPGSSGLVAVKASQEDVAAAAQSGGLAAVAALEVPAAEARAVVWSGRLGSGSAAMAVYRLLATRPAVHLDIRNVALAAAKSKAVATYRLVKDLGSRAFLPMVRRGE
jgi:hypothetical protein